MDQSNPPPLPLVSVVICVYNNSQYLPDAISSALKQDYPNINIYVIDDCSTENLPMDYPHHPKGSYIPFIDGKKDEISAYKEYFVNNRYIYYAKLAKNSGPSRARNIAIQNALFHGTHLVQVLDSDDMMYPNKVTELIKPIMMDPERVGITYADYIIVNEQGLAKYESKLPYSYELLHSGNSIIHSGALISRLVFEQVGLYDESLRLAEDLNLWLRATKHFMALHIPAALTMVRSHKGDSTNINSSDVWRENYQRAMLSR